MNRLEQFLSSAARSMRVMPAAVREDELRELRGHLDQRAQDYEDQGMSADEAQTQAIAGLGSARALGSRLCDAWEGVPFNWWRLAAAIAGVTAFLGFGVAFFMLALVTIPLTAEAALLPELQPTLYLIYLMLPFVCGLIFSHWLGRRGRVVATLYFLALALAGGIIKFPLSSSRGYDAPPTLLVEILNASWFAYFSVVLAFSGAWVCQHWRVQRRHQLASAGAHIASPNRILWIPLNLKWWRNALLFVVLAGALYAGRVWLQFHPQTPKATLANYLRTAERDGFDAPQILELRELPPSNAAERTGTERHLYFRVAARAKTYFAASQIKYLSGKVEALKRDKRFSITEIDAALERVKNNHQVVEGKVRLVQVNGNWQVDGESFDSTVLWEWFYDR